MTDQGTGGGDDRKWLCPWCGAAADFPTAHQVTCETRTCACGAVALGAPPWAFAMIVGAAVTVFGVRIPPGSAGVVPLLLEDIRRSGVEIREGMLAPGWPGTPGGVEYQYVWFRQQAVSGG
jgi:hypothetical protein